MNYFAHGRRFVERPYVLAGTALPDWLSVVDRRLRVRRRHAEPLAGQSDRPESEIARGVLAHLDDDRWFHETRAFAELSLGLSKAVREVLTPDDGFRPSFLGHILVEILLDAALIEESPARLEAYYRTCGSLDGAAVAAAVETMLGRDSGRLAEWVGRFASERFLWDYLDDGRLLFRLNQVMRRVRLPALPDALIDILPEARRVVRARKEELLNPAPH
jgi:hypothetical protein